MPLPTDTLTANTPATADTLAAGMGMRAADTTQADSAAKATQLFTKAADGTVTLGGRPLFDTPFMQGLHTTADPAAHVPEGEAGVPLPFRFRNDDFVASALLLCLLLIAWVVGNSRHYLAEALRNFSRPQKQHSLFMPQEQAELRGSWLLLAHTAFAAGILMTACVQEFVPTLFAAHSPYAVLGAATLGGLALPLLKLGAYGIVNNVFYDRATAADRRENYLLSMLCMGLLLYPIALLTVFFDLPAGTALWCVGGAFVLSKALLLKSFLTFSGAAAQKMHIFLYFCTLEMLPLLSLWAAARAYIV